MKRIQFIIMSLAVLMSGVLFFQTPVHADSIQSALVVSPMYQRIILTPGETTEMSVKVSNPNLSQNTLEYSVSVGSFTHGTTDDPDAIDTESISAYNQIIDWINLAKTSGRVEPNGTDVVNFTIDVPDSAPAGGQYATIIFRDNTSKSTSGANNINFESTAQVASIIYAEVAGSTINTAEILENNLPSFLFSNKLEATSLVKNTGNVHSDAEYTLQVWPLGSSEEICTNEEDVNTNLIMPGMERYYTQTCQLPMVGIFTAKQTVKIFGEESIVEKTIIVCPIWLLFIIIFAIVALIIWLVLRAKGHKKAKAHDE